MLGISPKNNTKFFNIILYDGTVPRSWQKAVVILIHKKGVKKSRKLEVLVC
jgi:hypothetical protein